MITVGKQTKDGKPMWASSWICKDSRRCSLSVVDFRGFSLIFIDVNWFSLFSPSSVIFNDFHRSSRNFKIGRAHV